MKGLTLLVVDDEPAFRASVAAVLRLAGYDVVVCEPSHATQTRDRLRERAAEVAAVVVVDPRRPVGLALVQSLCEDATDVLAVVGCCDGLVRRELEGLGCEQLDKPVDRDALLGRVGALVARRLGARGPVTASRARQAE